jgi:hypothetical protein
MVLGMALNVVLALPIVLIVWQSVRRRPVSKRRVSRRRERAWNAYQETMRSQVSVPALRPAEELDVATVPVAEALAALRRQPAPVPRQASASRPEPRSARSATRNLRVVISRP